MSSGYSPWFYRKVLYRIPRLFKKCPDGNYHWFWHRLCFCREHEHGGDWHGGILDFKTGAEYHRQEKLERVRQENWSINGQSNKILKHLGEKSNQKIHPTKKRG